MITTAEYKSPLGRMLLAAEAGELTGVWFTGQQRFGAGLPEAVLDSIESGGSGSSDNGSLSKDGDAENTVVLEQASRWLDIYFSGQQPDFMPPLRLQGTEFQNRVWQILREIPWGQTMTYGEIAALLEKRAEGARVAAQAVGGAVGRNSFTLMVPCHRVLGAGDKITGYAGDVDKKLALLQLEGINL